MLQAIGILDAAVLDPHAKVPAPSCCCVPAQVVAGAFPVKLARWGESVAGVLLNRLLEAIDASC